MSLFPPSTLGSALLCLALATGAIAQDHLATDPDEIAAECGGAADAGEPIFQAECSQCHSLSADAAPKRGPHLQEIAGRVVGSVEGYDYSAALRLLKASGKIWEREDLHAFLTNPAQNIPGNRMDHAGITDEQTRRDLMTYIRIASLAPPPEPGTLVLSDEVLALEGDRDYGEYLGGECVTCHQEDKAGQGVPMIHNMDRGAFIYAMHEYRLRARSNAAMQMVAGALGDEEIASLAAYFTAEGPTSDGN
ncbi:c-type cytochrome [Pseudooceanicola sp. MF1-13]|uniref:c-type cytochrome n=1 Tax=Pseudooceanicola sp. MF1-13 TaxID=3379095 RepID=UPI003891E5B5